MDSTGFEFSAEAADHLLIFEVAWSAEESDVSLDAIDSIARPQAYRGESGRSKCEEGAIQLWERGPFSPPAGHIGVDLGDAPASGGMMKIEAHYARGLRPMIGRAPEDFAEASRDADGRQVARVFHGTDSSSRLFC